MMRMIQEAPLHAVGTHAGLVELRRPPCAERVAADFGEQLQAMGPANTPDGVGLAPALIHI